MRPGNTSAAAYPISPPVRSVCKNAKKVGEGDVGETGTGRHRDQRTTPKIVKEYSDHWIEIFFIDFRLSRNIKNAE